MYNINRQKFLERIERKKFAIAFAGTNTTSHAIASSVYGEECFIFAEAEGAHAEAVARELADTAIISYKHLLKSKFYYQAKMRLMEQQYKVCARFLKRIRKNNITVNATLSIFECSSVSWWADQVGSMQFCVFKKPKLIRMLPKNLKLKPPQSLKIDGIKIISLQITGGILAVGDRFLFLNQALSETISLPELEKILNRTTSENLQSAAENIIKKAKQHDANSAYGIYIWEKLAETKSTQAIYRMS